MPEQANAAQPAAATKSKHSHAASQAQPAPRKVRFNVGACISQIVRGEGGMELEAGVCIQVHSTRCSMSSGRARTASFALRSTDRQGARSPSRRSRPSTTPCFASAPSASSSSSSSSPKLASVRTYVPALTPAPRQTAVCAVRVLTAVRLCRYVLRPQIISILDIIKPPSIEQFKEVYRA